MIPEDDYPRLLKACRISGTLLVLAHGWTALMAVLSIGKYGPIFDSMLEGGTAGLPPVVQALIRFQIPLGAALSVLFLGGLGLMWKTRLLSRVVLALGVTVSLLSFAALVIDRTMQYPIQEIIAKFSS